MAKIEIIENGPYIIKNLEKVCEGYVERRMNTNIRKAMAGQNINKFEQREQD